MRDVADVAADDGLVFDVDSFTVREIRDGIEYPGLRVRLSALLGTHRMLVAWDVSTGDPTVPAPELVQVPRVRGDPITMLGYAPETMVAEKAVTILERGITSTRWRVQIDIVRLSTQHGRGQDGLLPAAQAVARYGRVALGPVCPVLAGCSRRRRRRAAEWRPGGHGVGGDLARVRSRLGASAPPLLPPPGQPHVGQGGGDNTCVPMVRRGW